MFDERVAPKILTNCTIFLYKQLCGTNYIKKKRRLDVKCVAPTVHWSGATAICVKCLYKNWGSFCYEISANWKMLGVLNICTNFFLQTDERPLKWIGVATYLMCCVFFLLSDCATTVCVKFLYKNWVSFSTALIKLAHSLTLGVIVTDYVVLVFID